MNLVVPARVVALATSLAVAALLFVRRGAPDGGYFHDGDRGAGVFGVLATGLSVALGFITFSRSRATTSHGAERKRKR